MAELKNARTGASVDAFLDAVEDVGRREECRTLARLLSEVSGDRPEMWGPSMVGFGSYRYRYESGREGEWFLVGFAPRKRDLTLYFMDGFEGREALLASLGPHRVGKSCLYVRSLSEIDLAVLEELARASIAGTRRRYGP